ncbi:MAG: methionyl-tRNA formyltransferase [Candidatus Brennerbacteria bacterium]|nr:methionyl-tRNA formyltransferase [Candidatus Brennerbacteria bacterium]
MLKNYKFAFFGTPEFAAIILEKLITAGWIPAVVICNPDKPVGRKKIITSPPVKQLIANNKWQIEILQPDKLQATSYKLQVFRLDFAIVAAYGKIISKNILNLFSKGVIGVHPSLLPKYRGPSPIQASILNGDAETGVSLFLMDDKIDNGPILANGEWRMENGETYQSLLKKSAEKGAELLIETLPEWLNVKIKPISQDEDKASYTKKFITEDGFVDLKIDDSVIIERKIRALNPEPGVYAYMDLSGKKKRVKLLDAVLKDGHLLITKIQPEGQKPRNVKIIK